VQTNYALGGKLHVSNTANNTLSNEPQKIIPIKAIN